MALFKILKGRHNKLDAQSKTDGWAWFTPDNGSFYIDALNIDGTNIDRIQINPKSIVIETEIYGSGSSLWDLDNKIFPIIDERIIGHYNGYITVNSQNFNLLRQAALANFQIISCENGTILVQAKGNLPTETIPVTITMIPALNPIYYTLTFSNNVELSNPVEKIKENSSYTTNLSFPTDSSGQYEVRVVMGDETILSGTYNYTSRPTLDIDAVTDNVIITVAKK